MTDNNYGGLDSLARAKPPVDVTTGYQQSEPANVADVGWG